MKTLSTLRIPKNNLKCAVCVLMWVLSRTALSQNPPDQVSQIREYVAFRTSQSLRIDGRLNDPAWENAPWTEDFIDIEGSAKPKPAYNTRAKILWDKKYLYIGAELEEPHIWATIDENDAVIFQENDFEIFIDPGNDQKDYYELEINALGTKWDLLLTRPYHLKGKAVTSWDIVNMKPAVFAEGTLNNPTDTDKYWSVEIAMPWKSLREYAPRQKRPSPGDQWRINFSRVQWQREVVDGVYVKKKDPLTGKNLPEDNWVWSPQGVVDMHRPEKWGRVIFSARHK